MILIVGLGNPGSKYKYTRHNLGFRVLDEFQKENNFPVFRLVKKFQAQISQGIIEDKKTILAKPQTFMNNSGQAVKKLTSNLQPPTSNLFVVHDDIDLPLGKIRLSRGRGSAGHKGVESIIKELGTRNFVRFRLGIKPIELNAKCKSQKSTPHQNLVGGKIQNLENFVLASFTKEEKLIINPVIKKASQAIEIALN